MRIPTSMIFKFKNTGYTPVLFPGDGLSCDLAFVDITFLPLELTTQTISKLYINILVMLGYYFMDIYWKE